MRARGPFVAAALAVPFALLAAACVEREPPPTATATATAAVETPAAASPAPTAVGPLTATGVADLLRRAVCWYEDPGLAASCLPPGAETVEAIEVMGRSGDPRFVAPLIDMRWLAVGWARWVEDALEEITGERFDDPLRWYEWAATRQPQLPRGYIDWKARLLSFVDPAFAQLLAEEREYAPRPDLLVWDGSAVDEVTPLREPSLVHRVEERYLNPADVVFGLVLNGQARAYPRRIIAWHRLVSDDVEGVPALIVFCTPCGGAVAFDTRTASEDEERYTLGSSGLVHDSRQLLFDEGTKSLWDALTGRPVGGELLGAGIELAPLTLITTTWADWSARHPNTSVVDLDTGHVRDYSPGAALRAEFASPEPAFPTSELDGRLAPKEPVLGVAVEGEARAYPAERVRERGIVHDTIGGVAIVLFSEGAATAIRVYRSGALEVTELDASGGDLIAVGDDGAAGTRWFVQESALVSTTDGRRYEAVPRRELYWFAWAQTYPESSIWRE